MSENQYLKKKHKLASYELPPAQKELKERLQPLISEGVSFADPLAWEYGLSLTALPENVPSLFEKLKIDEKLAFNMLVDLTAVDYLDKREVRFEVVYQLLSLTYSTRLCVRVPVSEDNPRTPSVRPLWASANFMEREAWDMYGIEFTGHGDLRRILMYDEFVGHPLRKDYPIRGKQPRVQLRLPEMRNTSADMKKEELVSLPVRNRSAQ